MSTQCAVCQGSASLLFAQGEYRIVGCRVCGHKQCDMKVTDRHPDTQYSDKYFTGGGAGYTDYLAESNLLKAHGRRYAQLMARHCAPGTLLDVGCAAGFVSSSFASVGWRTIGIDPNAAMVSHARQTLGVQAHVGSLEQLNVIDGIERPEDGFDLVLMIQVIAHFWDLNRAIELAHACTRPAGFCLIETWDSSSFTARALGRRWHEYSPPSVLHYFSRNSLRELMNKYGFDEVATGRPVKRLRFDHARQLLRYKYGDAPAARPFLAILDRVPGGIEVPYPSEDLFWALFQRRG